jgi:lipopolysaccharide export system protein LptA
MKSKNKWLVSLLLTMAASAAHALDSDVEQPVQVEANSATFDRTAGTATYDGKVIINQGTLQILADHVDILAPDNQIEHVTATGKPVDFKQDMENGKKATGKAMTMEYFVKEKRLTLTGEAELHQDQDVMTGHFMEYLADKGQLKAEGKGGKTGRISATLYPGSSDNKSGGKGDKNAQKPAKDGKNTGSQTKPAAETADAGKGTATTVPQNSATDTTTTATGKETLQVFTIPKAEPTDKQTTP